MDAALSVARPAQGEATSDAASDVDDDDVVDADFDRN
jgi:hypothetical protein